MNATGIAAVIHGVITAVLNLTFDSAYFTSAFFVHKKYILSFCSDASDSNIVCLFSKNKLKKFFKKEVTVNGAVYNFRPASFAVGG